MFIQQSLYKYKRVLIINVAYVYSTDKYGFLIDTLYLSVEQTQSDKRYTSSKWPLVLMKDIDWQEHMGVDYVEEHD